MTIPAWIVPLLLALGVIFLAIPCLSVPRTSSRPWGGAALVCGILAALLAIIAVVQT